MSSKVLDQFIKLVKIDSESLFEGQVAEYVASELKALGAEVYIDKAHLQTGGEVGNVIGWIAGDDDIEPLFLCAHLDTVKPGKGIEPIIEDGVIRSKGDTILAADDKSGVAMILSGIAEYQKENQRKIPLEIVFTVSEEIGLLGAKLLEIEKLRARRGFILDGNHLGDAVKQAPFQSMWQARVMGISAHAGVEPEKGKNAIKAAALAIAAIPDGRIDDETTCNTGIINGGDATNIVCREVMINGEVRSHNESKMYDLEKQIGDVMLQKVTKAGCSLEFKVMRCFDGYDLAEDNDLIRLSSAAFAAVDVKQKLVVHGGGSDANVLNGKGMEVLVVGPGMEKVHTTEEYIKVSDLEKGKVWVKQIISLWGGRK